MPQQCFIGACKSSGKTPGIYYFSFGSRLESWLNAIGIPNTGISPRNVLCSKHFDEADVKVAQKGGRAMLKRGAVPKFYLQKSQCFPFPQEQPSKKRIKLCSDEINIQPSTSGVVQGAVEIEKLTTDPIVIESSSDSGGLEGSPKQCRKLIKKFHTYASSTQALEARLKRERSKKELLQHKNKLKHQKYARLKRRVNHLRTVVTDLKKNNLISNDACSVLEKSFSGVPLALMSRLLKNSRAGKTTREKYDQCLRSFAMTLQFYSSKAYEYVRRTFNLALPSQRTIRSWYSNISCGPGFSKPAFESLKMKVEKNKELGYSTVCSLMLDEMSIKKQIDFFNNETWGYVDFGTSLVKDDCSEYAIEALVLMVVALNGQWKLPIAYFLIHSLNGKEKANIVKQSIIKLHDCGVLITSVTSDGPSVNFKMIKELGVAHFKKKIKEFLLSKAYYSVRQFLDEAAITI